MSRRAMSWVTRPCARSAGTSDMWHTLPTPADRRGRFRRIPLRQTPSSSNASQPTPARPHCAPKRDCDRGCNGMVAKLFHAIALRYSAIFGTRLPERDTNRVPAFQRISKPLKQWTKVSRNAASAGRSRQHPQAARGRRQAANAGKRRRVRSPDSSQSAACRQRVRSARCTARR